MKTSKSIRLMAAAALWLCALIPVLAQQVSIDEAQQSARGFMSKHSGATANVQANIPLSLAYTGETNGEKHYYIFNKECADGGFVIVGADEAAHEILAYSASGRFDYSNAPENMKWWLEQYDRQIAEGIRRGINVRGKGNAVTRGNARSSIAPLLTTKWDQGYPYNTKNPFDRADYKDGWYSVATGCVATAMAQIMQHHQYPTVGKGSRSYPINYNAGDTQFQYTYAADFGATTYQWGNMRDTYSYDDDINSPEVQAVATLIYHCGVSVQTIFSQVCTGGSQASTQFVGGALVDYFDYDKSVQFLQREYFDDDAWEQIIYDELAANRPVLYSGDDKSGGGGHAFVCHGYNAADNTFAINWGWSGMSDCYCRLSGTGNLLHPDNTGIGGGTSANTDYCVGQDIVVGIKPNAGGDYKYSMAWVYCYNIAPGVDKTSYKRGEKINIKGGLYNTSIVPLPFAHIAAKLTNIETNEVNYLSFATISGLPSHNYAYDNYLVPTSSLAEGTYRVQLAFRQSNDDEWEDMWMMQSVDVPNITIYTDGNDPTPVESIVVTRNPEVKDNVVMPDAATLSVTIGLRNNADTDQTTEQEVYVCYQGSNGAFYPVALYGGQITVPAKTEIIAELPLKVLYQQFDKGTTYHYGTVSEGMITLYGSFRTMTDEEIKNIETGIDSAPADDATPVAVYGTDGTRYPALRKGLNIVRMSNGQVLKVMK